MSPHTCYKTNVHKSPDPQTVPNEPQKNSKDIEKERTRRPHELRSMGAPLDPSEIEPPTFHQVRQRAKEHEK